MSNPKRSWVLLALTSIVVACTGSEVVTSSLPSQTSTTASPFASTTTPIATTAPSVAAETAEIRPWGPSELGVQLTMLLPDGWEAGDGLIGRSDSDDPANWAMVGASTVANIFADRCQWTGTELDPPVGPTVDDLATAFATVWGEGATTPVDAVLDGFAGKHMVLTVPTDVDLDGCHNEQFRGWEVNGGGYRWYQGPGQIEELWILDVEGDRILVRTSYFPELSALARAEQQQVIESIRFQVEATSPEISIARAFFDARNAYDVESATASFSPEAHVHEYGEPFITSVDMYPALFDWLRATGWQWMVDECHMRSGDANTSCAYHVENSWTRAMGLAPVQGGIAFEIWDGVMRWVPDFKVHQTDFLDDAPNEQLVEVWETVTDWIRANHPTDLGGMISLDGSAPVLDARSIDLWRLYTQEFVEAVE